MPELPCWRQQPGGPVEEAGEVKERRAWMVKERPPTHRICPLSLTSPAGREVLKPGSAGQLSHASCWPGLRRPRPLGAARCSHPPRGSQPADPLWGSWSTSKLPASPTPKSKPEPCPEMPSPYPQIQGPLMSPVPRFHTPLTPDRSAAPPFLLSNSVPSSHSYPVLTLVLHLPPSQPGPGLECAGSPAQTCPGPTCPFLPYSHYPPSPRLCPCTSSKAPSLQTQEPRPPASPSPGPRRPAYEKPTSPLFLRLNKF